MDLCSRQEVLDRSMNIIIDKLKMETYPILTVDKLPNDLSPVDRITLSSTPNGKEKFFYKLWKKSSKNKNVCQRKKKTSL